ncbi:hypothetical protein A5893_06145 [Pedobacter psychrophilus]|uniref:Uncharacterized protein n=1 Tax=Pedobacter psychrophilus TaxID=1826909 RepID=A0A179DHH5_9SPHI|nr:hypothetical protein [Pedobacter psychrophilus]OAQ40526.1 hypothetical protein A5893_06145 [Pedobacter psychrophilus]
MKNFRIRDLASKLGVSKERIIAIINDYGFSIENKEFTTLSKKQLTVLSYAYKDSVHQYFRRVKSDYVLLNEIEKKKAKSFFSNFLNQDFFEIYGQDLEGYELNNELIQRYFFRYIEISDSKPVIRFSNLFRFYKLKIIVVIINFKRLFSTIVTPNLFFTFTDEEDSSQFYYRLAAD